MFYVDADTNPLWLDVTMDRYDSVYVGTVKQVYGRHYDKDSHIWQIPIYQYSDFRKLCLKERIHYKMNPSAGEALEKWMRFVQHTELLKTTAVPGTDLRPYQARSVEYGKFARRFLNGDEMGLGKTVQSLRTVEGDGAQCLIVCEADHVYKWGREIEKWIPGATWTIVDDWPEKRREKWDELAAGKYTFALVGYEVLRNDVLGPPKADETWSSHVPLDWDWVVCDEAALIKNNESARARAVSALNAKGRIALTGTPIEKFSMADFWGIMEWLLPGYLGTWWQFTARFGVKGFFGGIERWRDTALIKEWTAPFVIARRKDDPEIAAQMPRLLPPKRIDVVISAEERELYNGIDEDFRAWLDDTSEHWQFKANDEVKTLRQRQFLSAPSYFFPGVYQSKLEYIKRYLALIPEDDKVILFTEFKTFIAPMYAREFDAMLITGDTDNKDKHVQEFQNDPRIRLLVATDALKRGHDLFAASWDIHIDLPWPGGTKSQRDGRLHRIGQTKPVTPMHLTCVQTIEEKVEKTCLAGITLNESMLVPNEDPDFPSLGMVVRTHGTH